MPELIPYTEIKNKTFKHKVNFSITDTSFLGIIYKDNELTFTFTNCYFENVTITNLVSIDFEGISVAFIDCYIESINVSEVISENIDFTFLSCVISGTIKDNNIAYIKINNCISKSLFLMNLKKTTIDVSYTEENIHPRRWVKVLKTGNTEFKALLETKQTYFVYSCKKFVFSSRENKEKKRKFYQIDFQTDKDSRLGYRLTQEEKDLLNINISLDHTIEIENSESTITDSTLRSLSLSGYSTGKVLIENTKIENWFIREYSSEIDTTFYNISPVKKNKSIGKIEFHKSNLDNTSFDNVDFSEYNLVSFYRTKFGKTTFTSCNFPVSYTKFDKFRSLPNVHYPDRVSINYYKDQYEIFLQIKLALEATGNFYESQKLQAIANDALGDIQSISNWDKTILWLNSKSNNHGTSIKRPLLLFLGFSVFFYILYLFSLNRIFNNNNVDYNLIGYYFSFIDITHRSDFLVEKDKFNGFSLSIDFVSKIIFSYFIYQFVVAFRKYGKR